MGLALLLGAARCLYVEVTPKTVGHVVGGALPAVLKFHGPRCDACARIAGGFSEASTRFPGVLFGGVDCGRFGALCDALGAGDPPAVRLYPARNRSAPVALPEPNDLEQTYVGFVEAHTRERAGAPLAQRLRELEPENWRRLLRAGTCGAVLFCTQQSAACPHDRPQFAYLDWVFEGDPNVTVGVVDCGTSPKLCLSAGVDVDGDGDDDDEDEDPPPVVKIWSRGRWANYTRSLTTMALVPAINAACGTERAHDGLLGDAAGRLPAADRLARAFAAAPDRRRLIEEARRIQGAELYVRAMERVLAGGVEKLASDLRSMRKIMSERKGSIASLDAMKKRYNVLRQFLPKETPSPPPTQNDDL
jgi:hypothetical protein